MAERRQRTEHAGRSTAATGASSGAARSGVPGIHAPKIHAPRNHAPRISQAREAAFAILLRVAETSAHSDDLLHGPGMSGLSQADRNLATTLVLGVLRWQIALDARMRPLLQRPDVALANPVAIALRLGAFQLLHLDRIPAHAALSESVELVRSAGHAHAAGMVNAILRKLTRQEAPKPKLYETVPALAERLAHPAWLVERWVREYGRAAALAVCEYDQHEPAQGGLFAAEVGSDEAGEAEAAREGEATPSRDVAMPRMDDGSRLVAELAAASQPGARRIWDCCAAPGGKTLVLARRHPEAELLATDVNLRRVRALTERLRGGAGNRVVNGNQVSNARTPVAAARVLEADATKLPEGEGEFELVLCDVPCSGTGTLARNPEIKERLSAADLSRQAKRQRELLAAALARVAPGGRLVYSTCSLEPEENERVVADVVGSLRAGSGVEVVQVEPVLERLRVSGVLAAGVEVGDLVRSGRLRTLPGVDFQGDGFFAALLVRK